MMPASNNGGGSTLAAGDVCLTPTPGPPAPVPYVNTAPLSGASGGSCSGKVLIDGKKAVTKKTEIPVSSGDEPGSAGGGVISHQIKGVVKFKLGSSKVKVEGQQLVYVGCMTGHNGNNANMPAGAQIAPSQTKLLVMP